MTAAQTSGDDPGRVVAEVCARLVAHPTVPGASTVPIAEELAQMLLDAGCSVRVQREYALGAEKAAVAAWLGPPEPGGLLLCGHLDVVPFADQPGWTVDPLRLSRRSGRLLGRGVADMKGFLAQCVVALGGLRAAQLTRPVVLLATSDEEVGCQGAGRLIPDLQQLVGVPLPRQALIGEPTSWRILRAHKGHAHCRLELSGRGGHSSRPDLGASAIEAAATVIRLVEAAARAALRAEPSEAAALFPELPHRAYNLGTIHGGTAVNMIPETCSLELGLRVLPGEDGGAVLDRLVATVTRRLARRHPGVTMTTAERVVAPAMLSPAAGALPDALARLLGRPVEGGAAFATDGGQLQQAGIDSWICGPGELAQAHQPDESIAEHDLTRGVELVRRLALELCAGPSA